MNVQEVIAKADKGEGLTEEEVRLYRANVRPQKHAYGKYGTLKRQYLEACGFDWTIADLPGYLHAVDRQAEELYEVIQAKLSKDERFRRTGNFLEDYRRQTEMQKIIEDEILAELIYVG